MSKTVTFAMCISLMALAACFEDQETTQSRQAADQTMQSAPPLECPEVTQGMFYEEFRSKLIDCQWIADTTNPTSISEDRERRLAETKGWSEVQSCVPTGLGGCKFKFHRNTGEQLLVTTVGEGHEVDDWETSWGTDSSQETTPTLSDESIESLLDGRYFYGEAASPDEQGANYAVFEKAENVVTGLLYININSGDFACFKGEIEVDTVSIYFWLGPDEAIRLADPNVSSIDLGGYTNFPFESFEELNDMLQRTLEYCIQGLENEQLPL
ncbi:hypothetical protein PN498_21740 [Oscillatoria sp. CS-180]|uniref:hypothetical protein n=1 Tax=Oscillatoria sp. CS-180 TaxID=3021720 RepID=UPI00232E4319|nr:hypothetical protein [Oscillatoria sp. CS-180]MDB9528629.1 hypothetical protein [Oscillatoria sp. CS-180]